MIEEVAGKIFHNQLIIRPQGNQLTAHMPPIAWSAFSDREIPTELCVSLPSFSCMQMHVRVLSQSQSPYQQAHPFPESCGHWWACWPQGVVGGGKVQAGNRNLHWHQWWVGGASPAHQSPRPPLILSNRRRNRPRRPTTSLRHPNPPATASSEWPAPACGAVWPLLQPTAASRVFLGGAGGRAVPQPSCLWLPAAAPHRP